MTVSQVWGFSYRKVPPYIPAQEMTVQELRRPYYNVEMSIQGRNDHTTMSEMNVEGQNDHTTMSLELQQE